ncbi:hypothetical protein M440DRAFT_135382 [Trichoderma longibrachiatum ATCC 18648]|uniref:Uncharacterized protein n=1 Tax=Trichoderma longibrachiatum ATCC 18648 TaxID=983965 RepID=A0A2T4BWD1_TRILO|nr:hypothetical protein M440DRAFT_135382 [Trichoderma longibrachiatum ATCC 18648]
MRVSTAPTKSQDKTQRHKNPSETSKSSLNKSDLPSQIILGRCKAVTTMIKISPFFAHAQPKQRLAFVSNPSPKPPQSGDPGPRSGPLIGHPHLPAPLRVPHLWLPETPPVTREQPDDDKSAQRRLAKRLFISFYFPFFFALLFFLLLLSLFLWVLGPFHSFLLSLFLLLSMPGACYVTLLKP